MKNITKNRMKINKKHLLAKQRKYISIKLTKQKTIFNNWQNLSLRFDDIFGDF